MFSKKEEFLLCICRFAAGSEETRDKRVVGEDCTVIVYKCLKSFNDDFLVHGGLHHGSVLSPSLFMIVLKTLIKEIRSGWPEELLYADDVGLVGGTLESKDWGINVRKTKILISGENVAKLTGEGKFPCDVCNNSAVSNCQFCRY